MTETAIAHSVIGGVPLLLTALLALWIFRRPGKHPASYKLSEQWTHEPILWAATGEVIGDAHGHGSHEFSVGGGASGKW
ncbi:hypothetical protein BH10ACT9_BH10ACT9_52040 [soil metagenome]